MRVLILGGYGFIGAEIVRRLLASGHEAVIAGRNERAARRTFPEAGWVAADLSKMQSETDWHERLAGIDAVVNAAGVLQDGARDRLDAVHHRAIATLVRACESRGVRRFVQISAVGARLDATTEFLRSKARGDAAVAASALSWFVVRPGLVIGPNAYGGTALIRVLAGVPLVQPMAFGRARMQTVAVADLARVVGEAIEGRLPDRSAFDLVEASPHALRDIVAGFRRWLGFREARREIEIPGLFLGVAVRIADALGHLGWRPPLRTTTLRVLAGGVVGDPREFAGIDARPLSSFEQTLGALPATLQERWFARLALAMPATIAVLALYWLLTGAIALVDLDAASRLSGLDPALGRLAVLCGSSLDIALGLALLYRPWAMTACRGMAAVTVLYLAAGTWLRPDLWLDPLGPLLKAVPILLLTIVASLMLEDR